MGKNPDHTNHKPNVSVVVPVYNSAEILPELITELRSSILKISESFEIILIDDGSKDKSWKILEQQKSEFPTDLVLVKLARNFGQNSATLCGMGFAKGKYIITIDDDLQIPPDQIPILLDVLKNEDQDIVYGSFKKKKQAISRNLGGWLLKKIYSSVNKDYFIASSFRVMKEDLAHKIVTHASEGLFIDQMIPWYTSSLAFVEIEHQERKSGKSGYSFSKLIKTGFILIFFYSDFPLKLMTSLGIFGSLFSLGTGIYYIWRKLEIGAEIGFTSVIVSIFFSTSLILFSLGILGEYLRRIYLSKIGKPSFVIQKVTK